MYISFLQTHTVFDLLSFLVGGFHPHIHHVPRTFQGSNTKIFYSTSWYRFPGKQVRRHVYITRCSKNVWERSHTKFLYWSSLYNPKKIDLYIIWYIISDTSLYYRNLLSWISLRPNCPRWSGNRLRFPWPSKKPRFCISSCKDTKTSTSNKMTTSRCFP